MKCVRELRRLLSALKKKGGISIEEVVAICVEIRQILELNRKYQNEYPIVNLFCNWVVHANLDRSNTIYRCLFDLSASISNAIHVKDGEDPVEATRIFIGTAGNVLQIPKLRKGIRGIFSNENIDTYLCDTKEWWDGFVTLLLKKLAEKPLAFPDEVINDTKYIKGATEKFEQLNKLPHANNWDKVYSLEIREKDNKYLLELSTLGRVKYVVELLGKEPSEAYASQEIT